MRTVRSRVAAVVLAVALVAGGVATRPLVHGLSFVVRAADMKGTARRLADLDAHPEREREIAIPTARGSLRARVYDPIGSIHRTSLLVSGLHPSGIDEPRLVRLARELSADHVQIVTPDIPELSQFAITPAITDDIEQSAAWLAGSHAAGDGRVGMMGISFSGGLSIVAAGRASLRGRVAYEFSFGGHDDLPRVLRYLCTGIQADGIHRPPHDYGVAVILLGIAERVVPADQVEPLRAGIRRYLWASALDGGVDKSKAESEFNAVREFAATLPEPSATLLRYVNDRDVAHLGPVLLPYIGFYGDAPSLSPSKSPKPDALAFLLHGTDDNVVPAIESEYLAADLRGHAPARLLLSGLISHAEADRPAHIGDVIKLASFWGDLLSR